MASLVHQLRDTQRVRAHTVGTRADVAPPKFSVVFILLDDVGVEYLDYHGLGEQYSAGQILRSSPDPGIEWSYFKTPRLTSLAQRGMFFENFFATSLCSTSRVRVHVGKRLDQIGFGSNIRNPTDTALDPLTTPSAGLHLSASNMFLAEYLRSKDTSIDTAHFGKWHMADVWSTVNPGTAANTPDLNLTDPAVYGFQKADWGPIPYGGRYTWWRITDGATSYVDGDGTATYNETTHVASVLSNAARTWLAARTNQFFLSLSCELTHMPLDIPPYSLLSAETQASLTTLGLPAGHRLAGLPNFEDPRIDNGFWPAFYANAEAMDTIIGRVEDSIPAALKPTTFIVVMGDNGGTASVTPPGFPFEDAKGSLTRGGTQVTCVVYGPRVARPGRSVKAVCDVGDIYATIAELMGHSIYPEFSHPDSSSAYSLVPAITDDVNRDDPHAIKPYSIEQSFWPMGVTDTTQFNTWARSIVDGRYRYLDQAGVPMFFDLRTDPLETVNLAAAGASISSSQTSAMVALKAHLDAVLPPNV